MFLATLTTDQKRAFLALADAVIRADAILLPQECAMLATMRAEMELPDDILVPAMSVVEAAGHFTDRAAKVSAMLELVGLALADTMVAPEEDALLAEIALAMGLSDSDLLAQKTWVFRQFALLQEARTMMMAEG